MAAARIIFRIVGFAILGIGFGISFFVSFFIKDAEFTFSYMQVTFLIYLVSQAIYYFTIPQRTLYEADQKKYIPNIIFQVTTIIKSIVEIIIVCCGFGLPVILISLVICSFVANLIIVITSKKRYDINYKAKKDFTMLKDVKDLFINTIGNLVANNIDLIIISKLLGLGSVVIYSTYNYFVEGLKQFIDKITGATMSSVGDLLLDGKDKALKIFKEFNEFVFFMASIICIPMFVFINKFIEIWYNGQIQVTVVLSLLFTVVLFYQITRIPLKVFTFSSGKFKVVKRFIILEVILNISLSLILINFIGMPGVLLATVISLYIADWCTKPIIIYREIFEKKVIKYYLKYIGNTIFIFLIGALTYLIVPKNYTSLFTCFLLGGIVTIINFIITAVYYFITKQYDFLYRFKILKGAKKA